MQEIAEDTFTFRTCIKQLGLLNTFLESYRKVSKPCDNVLQCYGHRRKSNPHIFILGGFAGIIRGPQNKLPYSGNRCKAIGQICQRHRAQQAQLITPSLIALSSGKEEEIQRQQRDRERLRLPSLWSVIRIASLPLLRLLFALPLALWSTCAFIGYAAHTG